MIEELREYTEEAMKIEMAPWVESHTVDMDELYTELILEQIENKPTGQTPVKLDNYTTLFPIQEATEQQENPSLEPNPNTARPGGKQKKGKKILAKGDPGTGKSTLAKKIAHDWAKGKFTAVSLVFLVNLKLVEKGQTMENIIIQQNPPIESLDITEKKLCKILKDFGKRCLIILDGFDEYDPQPKDDIYKIIEGRKLPHCSLVVTSRPHNCEKIERYFTLKVKVNGFTKTRAEQLTSNCLNDREKIQAVCNINGSNFLSPDEYSNPMLLLFLCVLGNNDELDFSKTVVSLGEIYFRLIRCMYRKYCVRKGIEFDDNEFIQVLKRVGKVAWEMLDSSTNFAKHSEVIREVGGDAFEYGLFAGHKDIRLAASETKDIFVVFIHQTVQVFLGAFHCTCAWNTSGAIHTSDRFPIIEFYYLRFCPWLLSHKCSYIQFYRCEDLFMALAQYVARKIDFVQVDLTDFSFMFTTLQMSELKNQDDLLFHFMTKVLSLCENVKELFVNSSDPIQRILEALSSSVPSLVLAANKTAFLNANDCFRADNLDLCENQLVVLENTTPYLGMAPFLNRFVSNPLALVILANETDEDLTELCHKCLNKLIICGFLTGNLTAKNCFPCCPSLTHFAFQISTSKKVF